MLALERFAERWDNKYSFINRTWRQHWQNLRTFFCYSDDIRQVINTTSAIDCRNSVIRMAVKKRKVFPSDDSARKVVYLALMDASRKLAIPIRSW